jgi:hypothetical protein
VLGDGIDYVNHFDAFPLHVAMNGEDAERRDQFKFIELSRMACAFVIR